MSWCSGNWRHQGTGSTPRRMGRRPGAKNYDAVVTDMIMPVVDGRELYRRIREMDEAMARRVVFMTGDTLSPETSKFIEDAGSQTLGKPFSEGDLRDILKKVQEQQHDKS